MIFPVFPASSLAFIGCIIHHDFPADTVESCTNTEIVALSFSIMTNIAATGSIGYIAWLVSSRTRYTSMTAFQTSTDDTLL